MKRKALILALSSLWATSVNSAEISGSLEFASDNRLRGISLTGGDLAMHGNINVFFENGIYAGIVGSNVDFGDDANMEVLYIAGYGGEINADIGYGLTLLHFSYPGQETDSDFTELSADLHYKNFTLNYTISNDTLNTSERSDHVKLKYSHPITENWTLNLHGEHNYGSYYGSYDIDNYQNYSIGLSGQIEKYTLSIDYLFNSINDNDRIDRGYFKNDDTILLKIGVTF